jgi:hypothetical protein
MRKQEGRGPGSRIFLAALVVALLGLCAGAAVPGSAYADDDDNGDNGGNSHQCTGTITPDPLPNDGITEQICVITPADGTNEACVQRSSDPVVRQTCIFTQQPTVPAANNRVTVIQVADQHGAEGLLDAEQNVQGQQSNTTAHNIVNVTQVIEQVLASGIDDDDDGGDDDDNGEADEDGDGEQDDDNGEENGPPDVVIEQNEQVHQWVDICQGGTPCDTPTGMSGRNESRVSQSETQHEFAANAATIFQFQNFEARPDQCSSGPIPGQDDEFARECYMVQQHTTRSAGSSSSSCPSLSSSSRPANLSCLKQYSEQLQVARNAEAGHQGQGEDPVFGGIDHSFVQNSVGIALLFDDQEEHQTQSRTNTGAMTQHQFGMVRKGSGTQEVNPNSLVDIEQLKVQDDGTGGGDDGDDDNGDDDNGDENGDGFSSAQYNGEEELPTGQTGLMFASAFTSGECLADLELRQDEQTETAQEGEDPTGPDVCAEFIACGDVDPVIPPDEPPNGDVILTSEIVFPQQEPEDTCVSSDDPPVD